MKNDKSICFSVYCSDFLVYRSMFPVFIFSKFVKSSKNQIKLTDFIDFHENRLIFD
jgi:hypothetical protein